MGVDIVTMQDCASNYGVFEVPGTRKGTKYTVTMNGSEGPSFCTCPGFQFRKDCRHLRLVWQQACLYNPQWHSGQEQPELRPVSYTYTRFTDQKCKCGGPMVPVKRAV